MLFFILLSPAYRIGTNVIVDAKYKKGVKNDPFKLLEIVFNLSRNNLYLLTNAPRLALHVLPFLFSSIFQFLYT